MRFRFRSLATLLASLALMVLLAGCQSAPDFRGTAFEPPEPAAAFTLTDQFGQRVSLADFEGKVVALTFLYTNCPDICPLTADALRKTHEALGEDAGEVAFVAVSVDPARDTVAQAHAYSEQKGMLDRWRYLTGSLEELQPLWQAYFVAADPYRRSDGGVIDFLTQSAVSEAVQEGDAAPYLIGHQAPVYLIGRDGQIRVLHSDVTLDATPLIEDIRALLG